MLKKIRQAQTGNIYFTELAERVEYGNKARGTRRGRGQPAQPTAVLLTKIPEASTESLDES